MNKKLYLICVIFLASCSLDAPKYLNGTCITPTNSNYSWYGKFAKIEDYTRVNKTSYLEEHYILSFPNSGSQNSIFNKDIEKNTKSVTPDHCI